MRTIRHPLSGARYDLTEDGTIEVVARDDRRGRFTRHGEWIDGELRQADPHLCLWLADSPPTVPSSSTSTTNEGRS